jgi:hypothetical protein
MEKLKINYGRKQVKFVLNGRTKQKMPLYYQLAENTQKIKRTRSPKFIEKRINENFFICPWFKDEAGSCNRNQIW